MIDGIPIRLAGRELLVAAFLYLRAKEGKGCFGTQKEAVEPYLKFVRDWMAQYPQHPAVARIKLSPVADDLTKGLSSLRRKLGYGGVGYAVEYLAPERARVGFRAKIR